MEATLVDIIVNGAGGIGGFNQSDNSRVGKILVIFSLLITVSGDRLEVVLREKDKHQR